MLAYDRKQVAKQHFLFWSLSVLQACEEISSNLVRNAKTDDERKRGDALLQAGEAASSELLNGVAIQNEIVTVVAQKPLGHNL